MRIDPGHDCLETRWRRAEYRVLYQPLRELVEQRKETITFVTHATAATRDNLRHGLKVMRQISSYILGGRCQGNLSLRSLSTIPLNKGPKRGAHISQEPEYRATSGTAAIS